MSGANPWKLGGLSLTELGRLLWRKSQQDEVMGRAAQLAYYALLALFPALIFLTALMGLLSVQRFMPELMSYLRNVLPADALSMVERFLSQVAEGSGANILSLGALGALWASSSAVTAMMDALNVVFDVKEDRRPFWRVRLIAILLTMGLAGFVIMSLALVLYGPTIGRWIADRMGFGIAFTGIWNVLQWPVIAGLMLVVVATSYHMCPDHRYKRWRLITPGALFAVVMWLVVSLGFKAYVDNFSDYNKVYGSIAGVIVLMLWFYWTGLVLLIGGEINAEIEKAAAERKAVAAEQRKAKQAA
jgi:membrane protein